MIRLLTLSLVVLSVAACGSLELCGRCMGVCYDVCSPGAEIALGPASSGPDELPAPGGALQAQAY